MAWAVAAPEWARPVVVVVEVAVEAVRADAGRGAGAAQRWAVSADWVATPVAGGGGGRGGSAVPVPAGVSPDHAAGSRSHLRMYCSAAGSQLNQSSSPAASE
ncbi:hypothetical protein AB4Z39_28795 [Mycobacterium adipatum]|uniref:hypothetical protein n=1 Tax=Mycobacterium adipatum TaxID=1682113 RepID=UPI0034E0B44F